MNQLKCTPSFGVPHFLGRSLRSFGERATGNESIAFDNSPVVIGNYEVAVDYHADGFGPAGGRAREDVSQTHAATLRRQRAYQLNLDEQE